MATEDENKAVVRRFWNEVIDPHGGYIAGIEDVWADDLVWHGPHMLGTIRGKAAFEGFVREMLTAFPAMQARPEAILADGDIVTARYSWQAANTGPFMGHPPTNREVTVTGISIYRVANGKIAEEWFQQDFLGLLQQLGMAPVPGQGGGA